MNAELIKILIDNNISEREACRIIGKGLLWFRQATAGYMTDKTKLKMITDQLNHYIQPKKTQPTTRVTEIFSFQSSLTLRYFSSADQTSNGEVMSNISKLSEYSDDELFEELIRRRNADDGGRRDYISFCDHCEHFVPWSESSDPPQKYNPCSFGHDMNFRTPTGYDDVSWGFFRRVCPDRLNKEDL